MADDQRDYLHNFLDSNYPDALIISQNIAGHLQIHVDWPSEIKHKGVYFVKKDPLPIPEGEDVDYSLIMTFGDVHSNVLGNWKKGLSILKIEILIYYEPPKIYDKNEIQGNTLYIINVLNL